MATPSESDALARSDKNEESQQLQQELWSPSGSAWRDFLFFCGPGWLVSSEFSSVQCGPHAYVVFILEFFLV